MTDYKIEKLQDWETISFINGKGTTTENQYYSFIDSKLIPGKYSYRLKQIDFDGSCTFSNTVEIEIQALLHFSLEQNYPNPFNPSTIIRFTITTSPLNPSPYQGEGNWERLVTLKVYDILGNEVVTLLDEYKPAGEYEIELNSHSGEVRNLHSGVYFYQLKAGNYSETKKMLLLK
jgi:hypothetical protein